MLPPTPPTHLPVRSYLPSYFHLFRMASWGAPTPVLLQAPSATETPIAEEEEYYSSWSLFLVCLLLILSLWTSYYLQIKRIKLIHETLVAIVAGMFVGLVVRLAPGTMIREMLVSPKSGMFVVLVPHMPALCVYYVEAL